jgi:hypothetical protein
VIERHDRPHTFVYRPAVLRLQIYPLNFEYSDFERLAKALAAIRGKFLLSITTAHRYARPSNFPDTARHAQVQRLRTRWLAAEWLPARSFLSEIAVLNTGAISLGEAGSLSRNRDNRRKSCLKSLGTKVAFSIGL